MRQRAIFVLLERMAYPRQSRVTYQLSQVNSFSNWICSSISLRGSLDLASSFLNAFQLHVALRRDLSSIFLEFSARSQHIRAGHGSVFHAGLSSAPASASSRQIPKISFEISSQAVCCISCWIWSFCVLILVTQALHLLAAKAQRISPQASTVGDGAPGAAICR